MRSSRIGVAALVLALATTAPLAAHADTLYVAPPAPAAPGHPMRLGADHKAFQVGDLVNVLFNFAVNSSTSLTSARGKTYNLGIGQGTGAFGIAFLRFPSSITSNGSATSTNTTNGTNSFTASMMATVTDVLPSGVMMIAGDQMFTMNGIDQKLHITGEIRADDISNTDTVLSTQVANVKGYFNGNPDSSQGVGIIRKILNFLF